MRRIGLVVTENLRGHVNRREIIPNGDFSFVFWIPKNRPGIGRLSEHSRVIEKRIRAPHERDAIDLAIGFDEWQITEFGGELRVRGQLGKIERRGESSASNGSSDIAGR